MTQISLRSVSKAFGRTTVIPPLDFEIASGEFLVFLGPSGCGKSTLLRLVAGLEAVTSGDILIGGANATALEPRARGCAMVFQNYALYPHMTVAENMGYSLKVAGMPKAERQARVRKVAESVGLADFLERKPAQLSGGQRQRVAMARAMIRNPRIFLYDEPLSNLDARLRVAMRIEIRKLHTELGTTSLFVTHDQVEAMSLADRIAVMNKGKIEQVGTPAEIYSRPASTYVASFVGTPGMNLLPAQLEAETGILHLKDGQSLALPQDAWRHLPSGPVTLGFRAEDAGLKAGPASISATYHFSEELGPSRLVHLQLGGDTAVALHDGPLPSPSERNLQLSIDTRKIHLFAADTGRSLLT